MKKILNWMFLLALMVLMGNVQAQSQSFNYDCDFETDADTVGWRMVNGSGSNKWVISNAENHTASGARSMYISDDNGSTNSYNHGEYTMVYVYREVSLEAGMYDFEFDWKCMGEYASWGDNPYDYLRVALAPASTVFTAGTNPAGFSSSALPMGWIALDGGSKYRSSAWKHQTAEFEIATDGAYKLVFVWLNDGSGGNDPAATVDDIKLVREVCPSPVNFVFENITSESVDVSWTERGTAENWHLEWGPAGFARGTGTSVNGVMDNPHTITDLMANTLYDIYVESDCAGGVSTSLKGSFRTSCSDLALPSFDDFESYDEDGFPFCWFKHSGSAMIKDASSLAHSGNKYIELSRDASILSPKFMISSTETAIYFAARTSNYLGSGVLEVGYVTDTVLWNYTMVKQISVYDNGYHMYEVDFDGIDAHQEGYIVISQVDADQSYHKWYIDDVTLFQLGNCIAPREVYVSNITDSSATLNWMSIVDGSAFQIRYENNGSTIVEDVAQDATSFTLKHLTAGMAYAPMIRSLCSGTDSSFWQEVGTFSTEPKCVQLEDVRVSHITANSAMLSWKYSQQGYPSGALLKYKDSEADVWNTVNINIDESYYFFTGLTVGHTYEAKVMTLCGRDTSSSVEVSFATISGVCGESIGDSSYLQHQIPTNVYYEFVYNQSIYPSVSIEGMDTIRGIAYHSATHSATRDLVVYLANTNNSAFATDESYISSSLLTQVYSGSVTFSGTGWDTIMFTTPYVPQGGNLVVAVLDNTNDYSDAYPEFYSHNGSSLHEEESFWMGSIDITSPSMYQVASVPDVQFIGECVTPTCKAPAVAFANATENSIKLSWRANSSENAWCVDYRTLNDSEWTSAIANTTNQYAVVAGLIAGVGYEFRVGALCGTDTVYGTVIGYTDCGETATLPYSENFANNYINPCWRASNMNTSMGASPSVSSQALVLPASSYVILPEFTEPINTLQISFKMRAEESTAPLYIGVTSDAISMTSFTVVDTIYVNNTQSTVDVLHLFNNYMGNGNHIALLSGLYEYRIVVDDLQVRAIPSCPQPMQLHASLVNGTSATIEWEGDEAVSSWNVTVVPTGNDVSTGTPISTDIASCTLNNLTINTTYDVYVNAVCDDQNSPMSMVTFTTLARDVETLPYATDFSNASENAKWAYLSQLASSNAWFIGDATHKDNVNALYVSNDNGATNEYATSEESVLMAYLPIMIPEDGQYSLIYDWKSKGENRWDFGRVALVPASYNLANAPSSADDYSDGLPMGWIALDNDTKLQNTTSWNTMIAKAQVTSGTYYLTALWVNDGGAGSQSPIAIDNISMSQISCPEPMGVTVSEIYTDEATVTWRNDLSVSDGWEVSINGGNPIATIDTTYTFTNLTANTGYTVTVRAICAENDSSFVVTTNFVTACGEIETLPYVANFNYDTPANKNSDPKCWVVPTRDYPTVSTKFSETPSLYFYCSDGWDTYLDNIASMPMLSHSINVSDVEIQLRARTNYSSSDNVLYVGVCGTAGDITTFTVVDSLKGFTSEWSDYYVSFANYTDTGRYITFFAELADDADEIKIAVDDIQLQEISPCARPVSAYIDSYTHNSAVINWTDTNTIANFKVAVSSTPYVADAERIISGITTAPYTLTQLAGNTTYYVWVAADCSNLDTISGWVLAGNFTTNPTCATVENLEVIDIDDTHATLTWRAPMVGEPVTNYIVSYKMNDNEPVVDTVQTPYYFMSNLATDSNYLVVVTTMCNEAVSATNTIEFVPANPPSCNSLGNGDYTVKCPNPGNYNYAFAEMLFLSNELAEMGDTIRGVTFDRVGSGDDSRNVVVYMAETNLSSFGNAFEPITGMTIVYNGVWALNEGLSSIDFTTDFVRSDRNKNVILVIDDNTGDYGGSYYFSATEMNQNLAIVGYMDSENLTDASSVRSVLTQRPNVIFDATCAPLTCLPPSVVVANLTSSQVDLVWREGGDETAWKVEYRLESDSVWTVANANTTAKSASITNLLPGESYLFRVGAICGAESAYRTVAVRTDCGARTTPFYEDFDSYGVADFNKACWTVGNNPSVVDYSHNGHVLELENGAYVALPMMQGNLNTLQIRLRYLAASDTIWSLVGYMENPNEIRSFHVLDTIYDYNNISGYYNTVCFNSLAADVEGNIAIYTPHHMGETYIDDIVVEPIRSCATPAQVTVSNITTTAAQVAWTGNAENYKVEYGPYGFAQGEGNSVVVNTNSTQLSGLTAGTMYEIYLYAICGEGDTSYATNAISFTTECAAISELPYVMNFELSYLPPFEETGMIPTCWSVPFMDHATEGKRPQIVYDDNAVNGEYDLELMGMGMIALPEMAMPLNSLAIHFNDYATDMDNRLVVGVLDHIGDGCESTFQAIDTIVPIDDYQSHRFVVYFNEYIGTGKYIAFRNISVDTDASISKHYLDSIVVEMPSCPEVQNLHMVSATANDMTIDWEDISTPALGWQIEYGLPGFVRGEGNSIIVTSHPATITGLDTLTSYEIWVRPICSASDSGAWQYRPLLARTSVCATSHITTTAPNGYTEFDSEIPFDVYRNYSYSQTIVKSDQLVGQTNITAMSFVANHSANGKMDNCRIWIGHTSRTAFADNSDWMPTFRMNLVYTGDLQYDEGMVTILFDSAFAYDGYSNIIVAMDRDDGGYQYGHEFAVVSTTDSLVLIHSDDSRNLDPTNPLFEGEKMAMQPVLEFISCAVDVCEAPVLGEVTDLTHEAATIHWAGEGENYQVAFRVQSESEMDDTINVTANSYTFSNLTPNVSYVYAVRQVCGEEDYSDWTEGTFTTADLECNAPTDLNVVSKTANSFTLSWTSNSESSKWVVKVTNSLTNILDTVTANPTTITGLTAGQTYQVAVQSLCAYNYTSDWSETISVTTLDCLPVSNVTVSNITANSAQVKWSAEEGQMAWQIVYGERDFEFSNDDVIDVTTTSYTINNLNADTDYDVYVRVKCSDELFSVWSDVARFHTEVGSTGIDGVEGSFQFAIYPNPTSGTTTISLQGVDGKIAINVVDMNGRTVTSEIIECGSDCEKRIDVTNLAQGTYFVRILGDNINSVRKLIVR